MLTADAYPVSEGRAFIFRTRSVYLTLPATNVTQAITHTAQCQLLICSVNEAKVAATDHWIIKGTERMGACNNLQV
jgi:hypothetical protein